MKGDLPPAAFRILASGVRIRTHRRGDFTTANYVDMREYQRERKRRIAAEKKRERIRASMR